MAVRSAASQTEHDQAISAIARHYRQLNLLVSTNPGQNHNFEFSSVYPDVRVDLPTGKCYLMEVETVDSINDAEAAQWKEYGRLFHFGLIVPEGSAELAQRLVDKHAVQNVWIRTYRRGPSGDYDLSKLPTS